MLGTHDTDVLDAARTSFDRDGQAGGDGRAGGHSDLRTQAAVQRSVRERPTRVLVADDEYLIASDLAFTVNSMGFAVVGPVTDGYAALERARRELPDIALLDIRLPLLDGLAAAKELTEALDIPCIILSGYADADFVDAATAIGVMEYLTKPVQSDQLECAIDLAWRRFCRRTQERMSRRSGCLRLEERRALERAAGELVSRCGVSEDEARRLLRDGPRDSRRSLASLAEDIIRARGFGRSL